MQYGLLVSPSISHGCKSRTAQGIFLFLTSPSKICMFLNICIPIIYWKLDPIWNLNNGYICMLWRTRQNVLKKLVGNFDFVSKIKCFFFIDLDRISWSPCWIPCSSSHHQSKRADQWEETEVQVWVRVAKWADHGSHWSGFLP